MPWVKLDDAFPRNKKVRRVSAEARLLYMMTLCHCASELTDGVVEECNISLVANYAGVSDPANAIAELLRENLWEPLDGGYLVHDYHDYNPTREEVIELREQRTEAGRIGGVKSGESRRSKSEANPEANALAKAKQNGSKSEPRTQSRTQTHTISSSTEDMSEVIGLTTLLCDLMRRNDEHADIPKSNSARFQEWMRHIEMLIKRNGRDPPTIRAVIQWCEDNDFWKANILSTKKLREKFPMLLLQMQRERDRNNGRASQASGRDPPSQPGKYAGIGVTVNTS